MSNPVRKGAMAEARIRTDPAMAVACDDLAWLSAHGALGGVREIIRERRRQVQEHGYTVLHDVRKHDQGQLIIDALARTGRLWPDVRDGTAGYPETEEALRKAGALLGAEIDRLAHMLAPESRTEGEDHG